MPWGICSRSGHAVERGFRKQVGQHLESVLGSFKGFPQKNARMEALFQGVQAGEAPGCRHRQVWEPGGIQEPRYQVVTVDMLSRMQLPWG